MEEGVGDGGRRGAAGAQSGAAARGLGTGAGMAKDMLGVSAGASGIATGLATAIACLSTPARLSRSGTWGEVRRAAARMTGPRARKCGEPGGGGGSSNEAGTAVRTALANAGGVDWRLRSLVAMDRRGGKDRMKPFSLTASACRCSGGPLDLLQGVVPFSADHVQVALEGLQVLLCNT